jgi:alpha-mannosidase
MVGTTHFDPVWLWTWDEGMASIRSTFRAALARMEEEPRFIYSFSCPPVFEWIRQVDPDQFSQIQRRVREGRWHLVEGWWVEPDCNTAAGESYARQGLYGQRYLERTFGRRARTSFNTDSFGHNLMLPQILKKSGFDYYVFGRPSPAEKDLPGSLFRWQSPDGSTILAYRAGSEGANQFSFTIDKDARAAAPSRERLKHDILMVYGVSNHGGAPTRAAIAQINNLIADPAKGFDVEYSTTDRFFASQDASRLPTVKDELMVKAFGVFSNDTEIKAHNRRAEYALLNAEKAALLATLDGTRAYPSARLESSWQDLLFNQFHDILGGSSMREAYFDARNLHGRVLQNASEIINFSLQSFTRQINTSAEGFPVVVWNLNPFTVETPVEVEFQWAWEFDWYKGPLTVTDAAGNLYPCQVIQERSVLPGFRSRIVFTAKFPSLGYRTFFVRKQEQPATFTTARKADDYTLENERYRIEICRQTGGLASVFDKKLGKAILRDGALPVVREDQGDTWAFNVSGYGPEVGRFTLESAQLRENGPVRAVIRTKAKFHDSYLVQDFILYTGQESIEGKFRVYWREQHKVLKLSFDTLMDHPDLTSAIPYGAIRRKNDEVEMPTGEWLDVSTPAAGMALLSDSVFAYDMSGSRLNLTVLRSPIYGHLTWKDPIDPRADYEFLEQGVREGRWRMLFHHQRWEVCGIPREAMTFNNPVITITEANHPGTLPPECSYLTVNSPSCLLTTFKKAEDNEDLILRLYDYGGQANRVQISVVPVGRSYSLDCSPFEIKTIRLQKGSGWEARTVNILEEKE